MSRILYSDDEDFPGQFELWQANCERSIQGKKGQTELKALREALLALPEKRLLAHQLYNKQGEVCAIGAYARHKGEDLTQWDPNGDEANHDEVGAACGMPKLVAWSVVCQNDVCCGNTKITPEQRYSKMLAWVEEQLSPRVAQ